MASSYGWANIKRNSSSSSHGIEGFAWRNDFGNFPAASAISSNRCSIESLTEVSWESKNASRFFRT